MSSKIIDCIYKVGGDQQPPGVKLKSTEWAVLTQMDGKKTVGEIADTLAMSEVEITAIIESLEEQSVIENIGSSTEVVEYIAPGFFDELQQILIRLIGPVAAIIIDDILIDMGKEKDNVEKENISIFVEAVSNEIDDEKKKLSFQQIMLEKLQNY